jgi:DNA-3-methyladenine glycosylase
VRATGAPVAARLRLPPSWRGVDFRRNSVEVARRLIGVTLLIEGVGGVIVETEAYDAEEPAAHSFSGQTPRNAPLFGPPGHAYVYLSYGIHWCLNFVCRETGHGAGVLLRALEPTHGIEVMRARRKRHELNLLCSGPGRLGQALAVTPHMNGLPIDRPPFFLSAALTKTRIVTGRRIGITKAVEHPWRFGLVGSIYVSRPFR